jgi:CRAL/TRIO, N-terminal domain
MSVDTANEACVLKIDEKLPSSTPDFHPGAMDSAEPATTAKLDTGVPSTGPRKLPFRNPDPSSTNPPRVKLTVDEQTKYDVVLEHMKAITALPVSAAKKNKDTAPLSEVEQCFLTKECILRYLRATKWNVAEAKKRLEGTIIWRREYGTDSLTAEHIEPEVRLSPASPSHLLRSAS